MMILAVLRLILFMDSIDRDIDKWKIIKWTSPVLNVIYKGLRFIGCALVPSSLAAIRTGTYHWVVWVCVCCYATAILLRKLNNLF